MIEGNSMVMLAHDPGDPAWGYLALFVLMWLTACVTGLIGVIFAFFQARRKSAIAMGYVTVGIVALFVLASLAAAIASLAVTDWAFNRSDNLVGILICTIFMGIPCALGMVPILYLRQKNQPRKNTPPPRGPDQ